MQRCVYHWVFASWGIVSFPVWSSQRVVVVLQWLRRYSESSAGCFYLWRTPTRHLQSRGVGVRRPRAVIFVSARSPDRVARQIRMLMIQVFLAEFIVDALSFGLFPLWPSYS